jgi:hypothetical protein
MAENVPRLGRIITGEADRDAVHIAVVPLIAHTTLKPGEHIAVSTADKGVAQTPGTPMATDPVGIVDPFLRADVKPNQQFFAYLYPGTVISLRHHYRHPVLDAEEIRRETIEMLTGASRKFITECAEEINLTYPEIMQHAEQWLRTGEEVNWDPSMQGGFSYDEFWKHYEIVTGTTVPATGKAGFYTCC